MAKGKKVLEEPEKVEVLDIVANLSQADLERAVERYLGLHPKYIYFGAIDVHIDWPMIQHDNIQFKHFKPFADRVGL